MKKIMFNDKYGLTQAVLEGRKTQTRRIITDCTGFRYSPFVKSGIEDNHGYELKPKYEVGEAIAIAQSYSDCGNMPDYGLDEDGFPIMPKRSGYFNKMFVKADLMPHHIRITDVKVERLQDISNEDCLKEGVQKWVDVKNVKDVEKYGGYTNGSWDWFETPREAFSTLIDEVSGKGTWDSNPFVWVYEFELIN